MQLFGLLTVTLVDGSTAKVTAIGETTPIPSKGEGRQKEPKAK